MGTVPAPNIVGAITAGQGAYQDSLQEYQRAAQLKQQSALAGQQYQANALDIQQKQLQVADQQAATKAMQSWDGKNPDDIPDLIRKNGGSYGAYQAAQKQVIDRKTALSTLDKDQLVNLQAHHDAALGVIDAHKSVPDDQLGASIAGAVQDLAAQGHLQPAEAQSVIQHASSMPPEQFRPWLDIYEKGLKAEKEQIAQANQERETDTKEWKDAGPGLLINTRTGATKGTLRTPVDQQELNSYLSATKVPGETLPPDQRTPASFVAWKAKQSPAAIVMNNQLGPKGEGSALDQQAELYSKTHELPAGFSRSPGTLAAIVKRAAELHPDADLASNQATFRADETALKQVQTQFDKMNAFEGTALKNLDLYGEKAKAIPDLGAKFANVPLRMITGKMIGTQAMAELEAARQTASSEVAKVLNSATGSGVLSDSQKKEAENVVNGNYPLAATLGVIQTLKQDIANRHQSYQDDINAIKGRLGAKPPTKPPTTNGFSWDNMPEHK